MTTREAIHHLVDGVPEERLEEAQHLLSMLIPMTDDPVLRAFEQAPLDDEAEDADEAEGDAEALEDLRAGRVVSHTEAVRRLLAQP
jgi:hypothetical protein